MFEPFDSSTMVSISSVVPNAGLLNSHASGLIGSRSAGGLYSA